MSTSSDDGRVDLPSLLARVSIVDVLAKYGCAFEKQGNQLFTNCLWHEDKNPSLAVYQDADKGRVHCYSCGAHHDALDIVVDMESCTVGEAVKKLSNGWLKSASSAVIKPEKQLTPAKWNPCKPPAGSRPDTELSWMGKWIAEWDYHDTDGTLIGVIARYEKAGARKSYCTFTYGRLGESSQPYEWQPKSWPNLRPIYGLPELARNPDKKVLIVEGEKSCDSARKILPGMVCITWPGGANAIHRVDWQPLAGRKIVLWPDADLPGELAMEKVARYLLALGCSVSQVDTSDQSEGWDLADALETGWKDKDVLEFAKPRTLSVTSKQLETKQLSESKRVISAPALTVVPTSNVIPLNPAPHTAVKTVEYLPPEFSEIALARLWSDSVGTDWKYIVPFDRWLWWNGSIWVTDELKSVTAMTADAMVKLVNTGHGELSASQRRSICTKRTIANVLSLAGSDPRHATLPSAWDSDPFLLGTPAGVVDLRTGTLRPMERSDAITKFTTCAPSAGAADTCALHPVWDSVLLRCTGGDPAMLSYYQRWAGYLLTGSCKEEAFLYVHGPGGSGKSKFLNVFREILGDYAADADIGMLMENKIDRHTEEMAALAGARLVYCTEPEEGSRWREALLKKITGREPITARRLYESQFTFTTEFKLVVGGNFKPSLKSTGEEISRRMHLVEFPATIPESERVLDLDDRLRAEYPAILSWMISGCLAWQSAGLGKPDHVLASTSAYLKSEDTLGHWLEECIIPDLSARCKSVEAYESYSEFIRANGEGVVSAKRFYARMETRGHTMIRSNGIRYFPGFTVLPVTAKPTWERS